MFSILVKASTPRGVFEGYVNSGELVSIEQATGLLEVLTTQDLSYLTINNPKSNSSESHSIRLNSKILEDSVLEFKILNEEQKNQRENNA